MGVQRWLVSSQHSEHTSPLGRSFQVSGDMLVLAATMMGAFLLMAVLTDQNVDDDDDFGGGMMIPARNPV
jgi:hypothetical protein